MRIKRELNLYKIIINAMERPSAALRALLALAELGMGFTFGAPTTPTSSSVEGVRADASTSWPQSLWSSSSSVERRQVEEVSHCVA